MLVTVLAAGVVAPPALSQGPDPSEPIPQDIAAQFVQRLKPQLQNALRSGTPADAIDICAERAPAIAADLSGETGWTVKRVSLKPRNPRAKPDDWERSRLMAFDADVAAGRDPAAVEATVDGRTRYLAPQRVEGLCLLCHGEQIDPAVATAIARRYPLDRATGYQSGDVRGAISLVAPPR